MINKKSTLSLLALLLLTACSTNKNQKIDTDHKHAVEAHALNHESNLEEEFIQNVGNTVHFAYDKDDLNHDAKTTLHKQAEWLKKNHDVKVMIEGHCDKRGTIDYNLALGERRANSAKKYLISLGVEKDRIETTSYGKERPIALGDSQEDLTQNRRAVTVLTDNIKEQY